ncbi:MAG: homoserine kinase, partial [Acidimicrobiales bacterium]
GLGSSAASAASAAAAAGSSDALSVATGVDGHADNAAASVLGGLVTSTTVDGATVVRRLHLDTGLAFVVLVPERRLPTEEARRALPATVAHRDAAFNLGRLGLLVAGLADRRLLMAAATDDRLHQGPRTDLFPEAPVLLGGLVEAGALASCWSGAGPSLLALCDGAGAETVRSAGEELLAGAGVEGRSLLLAPDLDGLVVTGSGTVVG